MKLRTWFNPLPPKGETYTMESLTIPNQSYTPRQLLERFAANQSVPQKNTKLTYTGDSRLPDARTLDFVDVQRMYEESKYVQNMYKKEAEELKLRKKKQREAALAAEQVKTSKNGAKHEQNLNMSAPAPQPPSTV